ncbi:hypothetical protein JCM6882_008727 [Rhodosporidiobolus microsporus]
MLVHLTPQDTAVASLGLTAAFVFALPHEGAAAVGEELLKDIEGAVGRVVDKWRMLQGRMVKLEEPDIWAIEVPSPASSAHAGAIFTSARIATAYPTAAGTPSLPLTPFSPSGTPAFLPTPNLSHFRHFSAPSTLSALATSSRPLLAAHATLFTDALALGLSLPHGAFDATGMGMVVDALNAELNGREWEAPSWPSQESGGADNPLAAAVDGLLSAQDAESPAPATGADLLPVLPGWTAPAAASIARLMSSLAAETFWHKSSAQWVFLPQEKVEALVRGVKKEVVELSGGKEWVSSGDVLTAWVLKAAHSSDASSTSSVAASAVLNYRPFLPIPLTSSPSSSTTAPPSFASYPHNAHLFYPLFLAPVALSALSSSSLASLALAHRRTLERVKQPAYIAAALAATERGRKALVPERDWPFGVREEERVHRWILTNQASTSIGRLSLSFPLPPLATDRPSAAPEGGARQPLPLVAFYVLTSPAPPLGLMDQSIAFQSVQGGVILAGTMREARWEGVKRAVEAL